MLRIQLPERSAFRFGRKSYVEDKDKSEARNGAETEIKTPTHVPLPLVHHTSTKSLFDLFQPQDGSEIGIHTSKKEETTTMNPATSRSMPGDLQLLVLETTSVSPLDALGSHGDPSAMCAMPATASELLPALAYKDGPPTASTPSSSSREDEDGSGCSRKSSTSSVENALPNRDNYLDVFAAFDKGSDLSETVLSNRQLSPAPDAPYPKTPTKSTPEYNKPLPLPPSPERSPDRSPERVLKSPFSVSSVLSVIKADSFSKTGDRLSVQMVVDPPTTFHMQARTKPVHKRSASDGVLHSKSSKTFKVKSLPSSPRSKRGARLGNAMSEGRPHSRAHTLSSINDLPPGLARPEKPRALSMFFINIPTLPQSHGATAQLNKKRASIPISSTAAEKLVFEIMRRLDQPEDLLAIAAVSRGFRATFKRGEARLVHELLLRKCPAAWEFQKNSAKASGEPLSLRAYTKDKAALNFVKSALLASGGTALHPETMAGLIGADLVRQARIDTALWRIWTFCKGFGQRSLSEEEIHIQVDWLNGGRIARKRQVKTAVGRGNKKGVSVTDLEDLLEMWDGLGGMLSKFTNCTEARAAGIFERCTIDRNHSEGWFLEEWTYHIRSLGLPAILSVSSTTSFDQLEAVGFTDWTPPMPGQTRAGFFRSAVSTVYQERILAEAAAKARQFALPPRSQHRPSGSDASISSLEQLTRALERRAVQTQNLQIYTSPEDIRRRPLETPTQAEIPKKSTPWQPETPDTPYPMQRSDSSHPDHDLRQAETENDMKRDSSRESLTLPVRNSIVLQSLGMTSTASTRLGATLFPMEYPPTSPRASALPGILSIPTYQSMPQTSVPVPEVEVAVIDPVDKAMKLLTQDMGFSAAEASRALAKCDTGYGIDVSKTIELLARESGRDLSAFGAPTCSTPPPPIPAKSSAPTSPATANPSRTTCTGHHDRAGSDGSSPSAEVTKTFEPLCDTYPVRQPSLLGNLNRNSLKGLTRMTSKAKAYTALSRTRTDKTAQETGTEELRPPRLSFARDLSSGVERPSQPLPTDQRPKLKFPGRKTKDANKPKLTGIDEEPSDKARAVLGIDDMQTAVVSTSPTASLTTKSKVKAAKRFYEGRFSQLGWSDVSLPR